MIESYSFAETLKCALISERDFLVYPEDSFNHCLYFSLVREKVTVMEAYSVYRTNFSTRYINFISPYECEGKLSCELRHLRDHLTLKPGCKPLRKIARYMQNSFAHDWERWTDYYPENCDSLIVKGNLSLYFITDSRSVLNCPGIAWDLSDD